SADEVSTKPGKVVPAPVVASDWRVGMRRAIRLRKLSFRTETTYLQWLERFDQFLGARSPGTAQDEDVVGFLSELADRHRVAAATQNQAFNALLFFFRRVLGRADTHWSGVQRADTRRRVPVVLSREEVSRLLASIE